MNSAIQRRSNRRKGKMMNKGEDYPFFEISESVALLEQATEANQVQIQQVAENTSRQISDLAVNTDRQLREIALAGEKRGAEFQSEMKTLANEFSRSRLTNWPLMISILGLILLVVGGFYRISDLQSQVTMAPLVAQTKTSDQDRADMHRQLDSQNSELNRESTERKIIATKLTEVETQFKASDEIRNIQFAEQQRTNAIAFQIAQQKYPIEYPKAPYYFGHISDHGSIQSEGQ